MNLTPLKTWKYVKCYLNPSSACAFHKGQNDMKHRTNFILQLSFHFSVETIGKSTFGRKEKVFVCWRSTHTKILYFFSFIIRPLCSESSKYNQEFSVYSEDGISFWKRLHRNNVIKLQMAIDFCLWRPAEFRISFR